MSLISRYVTHFSLCHSFLVSFNMGVRVACRVYLGGLPGLPGWLAGSTWVACRVYQDGLPGLPGWLAVSQHYPPGTHENYNSFSSRNIMMEKGKELERSRRAGSASRILMTGGSPYRKKYKTQENNQSNSIFDIPT